MQGLTKQEFKEYLLRVQENYEEQIKELSNQGYKHHVDWEVVRKVRVYLHGKGLNIDSVLLEYGGFSTFVILESYILNDNKEREILSVIIITPDDTESQAYGKADRDLIAKYKKHLDEKGEN